MEVTEEQIKEWEVAANALGKQRARDAAGWITDGNESDDSRRRKLKMMDEGDPAIDQHLPPRPNLSDEWWDSPTPNTVVADVTGQEPERIPHGAREAIVNAYEAGIEEEFMTACEAELRAWVGG